MKSYHNKGANKSEWRPDGKGSKWNATNEKEQKQGNTSPRKPYTKNSKGGGSRGGRNVRRNDGPNRMPSDTEVNTKLSGLNDISWYTRNPELVAAAASFPYPYRPGMQYTRNWLPINGEATAPISIQEDIPGVMVMDWLPTIGRCLQPTDPANIVGREIFARVRNSFSGTIEADPNDFIIYLMALDSFFAYIAWLKRIYRTVSVYTPNNMLFPDTLMRAYGFTHEESDVLRRDKVLLWQRINELVLLSRKLTCPAVMDIFNRHYWMSDNIYADSPSPKAQFFVFNPLGFLKYNFNNGVSKLDMTTYFKEGVQRNAEAVVDNLFSFGRDLFNALAADETSYIISGYLQRAYEGVPSFTVQLLEQLEELEPVYVEEVLLQIENSFTIPSFGADNTDLQIDMLDVGITQNPGTGDVICKCIYDPYASVTGMGLAWPDDLVLNMRSEAPSVAENIIASRLQCVLVGTDKTNGNIHFSCGSEIPLAWYSVRNGEKRLVPSVVAMQTGGSTIGAWTNAITTGRNLAELTAFDWHPLVWLYNTQTSDVAGNLRAGAVPFGDVKNLTVISGKSALELHRVCLFSEFNAFGQG